MELERPFIERTWIRRISIGAVVVPPIASILGTIAGTWSVQQSILIITTASLLLLPLLLTLVVKILVVQRNPIETYSNDYASLPSLLRYIEDGGPKSADLIEYSALGAMPIIYKLAESPSIRRIRVLVAHPDAAVSEHQQSRRLSEGLNYMALQINADRAAEIGLQIGCYKQPASVRGRRIDAKRLVMGWYSHERREADAAQNHIWGGSNALVGVSSDTPDGAHLFETYDRVFNSLWADASAPALAWAPYRAQNPGLPNEEWMKTVAPKSETS